MSKKLSIVAYHYVRDLEHSRFPAIKGLTIEAFGEQIRYIKKYYHVISCPEFLDILESDSELPPRALLLTFDDGYIDHFKNVFPILDQEDLPACFFPPAITVVENKVLDVNKIQFVLASVPDPQTIICHIYSTMDEHRSRFALKDNQDYWNKYAVDDLFDPKDIYFIKRMLQCELPEELRTLIVDTLFSKYVTTDEESFAAELYMSKDQITCLHRQGMYIGCHGYHHYWLDHLDQTAQEKEIDSALDFMMEMGVSIDRWMMCYPKGSYDDTLLKVLENRNCKAGLTIRCDIADLDHDSPLVLPRLDATNLPKQADASPNDWTRKAMQEG